MAADPDCSILATLPLVWSGSCRPGPWGVPPSTWPLLSCQGAFGLPVSPAGLETELKEVAWACQHNYIYTWSAVDVSSVPLVDLWIQFYSLPRGWNWYWSGLHLTWTTNGPSSTVSSTNMFLCGGVSSRGPPYMVNTLFSWKYITGIWQLSKPNPNSNSI